MLRLRHSGVWSGRKLQTASNFGAEDTTYMPHLEEMINKDGLVFDYVQSHPLCDFASHIVLGINQSLEIICITTNQSAKTTKQRAIDSTAEKDEM
jgi:hypothetical protein